MTADLSALIARLEAAEVGSRELDAAIWCALNGYVFVQWDGAGCVYRERPDWGIGHQQSATISPVTTSLDAALALAERVLPDETFWQIGHSAIINGSKLYNAEVFPPNATCDTGNPWGHSSSPALALVIAILRAKQGEV